MGVDAGTKIHPQICRGRVSLGPADLAAVGFSLHPHPNPRVPSLGSIEVKSAVEVHDPVLRSRVRWGILDLGPLANEVDQGLRLDHRSWREFNCESTEFY